MDKYEYRIRAEEINALIEKKQFAEAVKIADTIDWSRVKSVMMLCKVSELYKYNRRFEDAKEILLLAYDRQPGGRKIVYSLCELCIKLEEIVQAVEYYKEFVQVAPTDTRRFILQYRLYEAQDVSLEERIAVLEEYKKRDYREKWAYELAYLYHRIGLATRCVEECDELILWFGEGKYVNMAMELKMLHESLSPSQQEKYDRRFAKEEPIEEMQTEEEEETALPIEIKSVDVTKAKTAEIIPAAMRRSVETADTVEVPDIKAVVQPAGEQGQTADPQAYEPEPVQGDEIPLNEPDMDIQVKTVDVGAYNTINLQQELAQNISRMFAEEDMEAADATMALPIETIIDTTTQNGKVINSITDDAIKDALLAPLLQDEEDTQITEKDLLASMEQERREKEKAEAARLEAERAEAARLEAERAEAARLEAERAEAERLEAERAEAARLEAERAETEKAAAVPLTAGAIMAAEIAQAVTSGNSQRLNITGRLDTGSAAQGDELVDEQITGQLSLLDIMNEWEETKKANEEKHIAEMREKVMKQTGPMFGNFDEIARASVSTDLNLINPAVDVFKNTVPDPEKVQRKETPLQQEEELPVSQKEPDEVKKLLNTEEINGLEEKLIETLVVTEAEEKKEKEVPSFIPDLDFGSSDAPESPETSQERVIIAEEVETRGSSLLAAMINAKGQNTDAGEAPADIAQDESQEESAQAPASAVAETAAQAPASATAPVLASSAAEAVAAEAARLAAQASASAATETEEQAPASSGFISSAAEAVRVMKAAFGKKNENVQEAESDSEPQTAGTQENIPTGGSVTSWQSATPATIEAASAVEAPLSAEAASAVETPAVSETATVRYEAGIMQAAQTQEARYLTKEEKELFGNIAPTKELQEKLALALDRLTMDPVTGNGIVIGENGTGRAQIAQNVAIYMKDKDPRFIGNIINVTGEQLALKDVAQTLKDTENGALVIEKAGGMEPDIEGTLLYQLERLTLSGILVIMEDTKEEIERLTLTYPQLEQIFTSKIEIEVLDNDGLVQYAKAYAGTREYAIDEMGVLAVYTRISDMQTNEHAVTIGEVRTMVDEAIERSGKKSVRHLVDVLIGKRFDDEDMIVLRENDFSIE
ncbi:MAG: hypothetical protein J6P60_05150 [Lachnospiraceae bacterium]|nr:hypothetical protein [Lachnospiraceae bacterium]